MFYKNNIDITNDKQMFNFLHDHFKYPTLNSWNGLYSIAHNVKLHKLNLTGDWCTALKFLEDDQYETVSMITRDWERTHPGYRACFNGRSGGYLVLCKASDNRDILPDSITDNDSYEEYKAWCRDNFGSVKANRWELVQFTNLVRDFDKLCDDLRDYVNELSKKDYEREMLESLVDDFNDRYADDLEFLEIEPLKTSLLDEYVDISSLTVLTALFEAFTRLADCRDLKLVFAYPNRVKVIRN